MKLRKLLEEAIRNAESSKELKRIEYMIGSVLFCYDEVYSDTEKYRKLMFREMDLIDSIEKNVIDNAQIRLINSLNNVYPRITEDEAIELATNLKIKHIEFEPIFGLFRFEFKTKIEKVSLKLDFTIIIQNGMIRNVRDFFIYELNFKRTEMKKSLSSKMKKINTVEEFKDFSDALGYNFNYAYRVEADLDTLKEEMTMALNYQIKKLKRDLKRAVKALFEEYTEGESDAICKNSKEVSSYLDLENGVIESIYLFNNEKKTFEVTSKFKYEVSSYDTELGNTFLKHEVNFCQPIYFEIKED